MMEEKRFSLGSCLGFIFKTLFFLILLGIVLGFVWVYTCVFRMPNIPDIKLPPKVMDVWNQLFVLQEEQCGDMGYWFGEDATRNENIIEKNLQPENEGGEEVPQVETGEESCGAPSINIEPVSGNVGDTFDIYLDAFSDGDDITACWFYPDGEKINCAELQAGEGGFRKTAFWSEEGDPSGKYTMTAKGKCSSAEITWMIEE